MRVYKAQLPIDHLEQFEHADGSFYVPYQSAASLRSCLNDGEYVLLLN